MDHKEYLSAHGLSEAFVTKKLHWKLSVDRIDIPIYNPDGSLAYTRTRMLIGTNKFLVTPGVHVSIPYGIETIKDVDDIVFCEGEPDAARLRQAGIPAITFPSGVTSVTSIDKALYPLFIGKTISIVLDNDPAGQAQLLTVAKFFTDLGATANIITLPPQDKDVCEYFLHGSTEEFYTFINSAKDYAVLALEQFTHDYPILTTTDFLTRDYPQPTWIVDPLIRTDGLSLIVGESGTGKTIFSLAVAAALSDGSLFLDRYPTTPLRTLILDKENTPADIQKLCQSMSIDTQNIHHFFTSQDYQLMDDTGRATTLADSLSLYVKLNAIDVVILDSVIDFFIGDENSSSDVAKNILVWRSIFPTSSILGIHHEGKTPLHGRRSASDRIRGSSVWKSAAQSILSLSVINPLDPATVLVEHTKVRGGKKCQPFEIHMDIRNSGATTEVIGYSFLREVTEEKLMSQKAQDIIIEFMAKDPKRAYTLVEIVNELQTDELRERTIRTILNTLCDTRDLTRSGTGRKNDPYMVRLSNSNTYQEVEDFIQKS